MEIASSVPSPIWNLLGALSAGLAVAFLILGLRRLVTPHGEFGGRAANLFREDKPEPEKGKQGAVGRLISGSRIEQRLAGSAALELAQADVALTVTEFATFRLLGAVIGFLVGWLLLRNVFFGIPFAAIGMMLPIFYLHSRRSKRQKAFQGQLVDVISMVVSGLRAGIGLMQALELVRKEMGKPACDEFGRVVREISLGVSQEDALDHLVARMPGDDLGMICTVIKIQAEVGGNLATVLETVISTIRERLQIAQEIRTLTAQQRVAGYILAAMPFGVGGIVMVINPGFMAPLFTPEWLWMPGLAVGMIAVGFVVISRIVDIKV